MKCYVSHDTIASGICQAVFRAHDCCCTVRYGLRTGPQAFRDAVVRLPGLTVRVGEGCTGCGACLSACDAGAIALHDGRASVDQSQCKGCGRCAAACPAGAIKVRVADEAEVLGGLYARIVRRTEIGLRGARHGNQWLHGVTGIF